MKFFPFFLILFGIIMIVYPQIIAYLLGGFFIVIGINLLLFSGIITFFSKKTSQEEYIKFGKYKIYK